MATWTQAQDHAQLIHREVFFAQADAAVAAAVTVFAVVPNEK